MGYPFFRTVLPLVLCALLGVFWMGFEVGSVLGGSQGNLSGGDVGADSGEQGGRKAGLVGSGRMDDVEQKGFNKVNTDGGLGKVVAMPMKKESFAYVTLLCDDVMLDATLVLAHSIKLTGSPHPFIVLTLAGVSNEAYLKLRTPGVGVDEVREVPQLEYPFPINDARRAINKMCRYSKLHLWDLDFTKIVYLDADVLVVKNIDDLFQWPEFSAALDMGGTYNTGVFVAEPSKATYMAMLETYPTAPSYNVGDQGFLNWFFTQPFATQPHTLPPAYNTPVKFKEYAIWPMQRVAARILHFTSETKPWTFWFTPHAHWERNFDAGLFYRWIKVRRDIEEILSASGVISEPLDAETLSDKPWPNAHRVPRICDAFPNYTSRFPITDQYSVLVGTWDRIPFLLKAISHYRQSSLVHTIFITWHNPALAIPDSLKQLETPTSANITTGPRIEFLKQHTNTLNNRFNPIRRLKTRHIFIADEDVRVPIEDIDFAFSLTDTNPHALIGFFPRGHRVVPSTSHLPNPEYEYVLRREPDTPTYSIMLTKSLFTPSDFLYTYTCLLPPKIHAYIDSIKNCEDIAFNMMVSGLTGLAPVAVNSTVDDFGTTSGISWQTGHLGERSGCLNGLVEIWGRMVLRGTEVQAFRYSRVKYRKMRFEEWV
ncbi:Exostoses (Multiple)-like 3 [Rhizophlyctis rosea]|uniref:Exostoses (Multiple)-like 3 n=1 Tax=Rhizophlyctis rosea TaxID=64517 RepID=A0AAD5S9L9_9FUNG|nr:Exostoses (Multiple)-like 3 [Rhizophlyctis rosea]